MVQHGEDTRQGSHACPCHQHLQVISKLGAGSRAKILEVEPDEPHIAAGRKAVESLRGFVSSWGLRSPFL